jgi:hypothetical protein
MNVSPPTVEEHKGIVRLHRWRWMASAGLLASVTVVPFGAKWMGLQGETLAIVVLSVGAVACLSVLLMVLMMRCPRCRQRAIGSILAAEFGVAPVRCKYCHLDLRRRSARQ